MNKAISNRPWTQSTGAMRHQEEEENGEILITD
jgi:hypothetical protein